MSGICGIVRFDGAPVSRPELQGMAEKAAYRGLHAAEYYCSGSVGIACLSLDTTPDGSGSSRPLQAANGRLLFAADARLDNRDDFTETTGERAGEASDAELIFAALLRNRQNGAERLLGDFAYAFHDRQHGETRLARDAMGMRSLYFRCEPQRLLFATEAHQILAAPGVPKRLNETAAAWHLTGMQTPPEVAFYDGIEQVRPGEELIVDAQGKRRSRRYWRPEDTARLRYSDEREYAEHLRGLFIDAMRARLRCRAPAGISLSGGIDSAAAASVAGYLRQLDSDLAFLRAYSWVSTDLPECDERENIERVAHRFGIPVSYIAVEKILPLSDAALSDAGLSGRNEGLQPGPHEDDPFFPAFEPSNRAIVRRGVSEGVSVMFYGLRGDMICGGDVTDVLGLMMSGKLSEAQSELGWLKRRYRLSKPGAVFRFVVQPLLSRFAQGRKPGDWETAGVAAAHVRKDFLVRAGLPARHPLDLAADSYRAFDTRQRFLHVCAPMVYRTVQHAERFTAGYGLGVADPWSDRRIAEFALACPQHLIGTARAPKRLAKRAMDGIMPPDAIAGARKVVPSPIYERTLRRTARSTVLQLLTDSRCAQLGYIDEQALRAQFERFVRGGEGVPDLWPTLSLEIWLRKHW